MQGLTETGASVKLKGFPSAHSSKRLHRRYGRTLMVVAIPALLSGLIAGFIMSGGEKRVTSVHNLAQRADMLRYAQSKIVTSTTPNTAQVQTSAVHAPVSNLDEVSQ